MMHTVVGMTFRPEQVRESFMDSAQIGDEVHLRADPNNLYDSTAVACYHNDLHIGFIPKDENADYFARLMEGEAISGEIVMFQSNIKPVIEIE